MATVTTNLGLTKPALQDNADISVMNANMDLLDAAVTGKAAAGDLNAHAANRIKHPDYAVTNHNGNAYTVTISGLTELVDGYPLCVKFDVASTGAITINPNGLGAKAVVDYFGNAVTNVRANLIANLRYDAVNGNFQLQGKGGGGNAVASHLLQGKTATVDTGLISGSMVDRSGDTAALASVMSGTTIKLLASEGYRDGSNDYVTKDLTTIDPGHIASNIRDGVNDLGVVGTFSHEATNPITPATVLAGKKGFVNGAEVDGTMPNNGAVTITPTTADVTIAAGYHNGSGKVKKIQDAFTYSNIAVQSSAPNNPSLYDIWVQSSVPATNIYLCPTTPESPSNGALFFALNFEYIEQKGTTNGSGVYCRIQPVSRLYDSYGNKPSSNIKILTSALYDLWVAPPFARQWNASTGTWQFKIAYYWDGAAWTQHSWEDFYAYAGNYSTVKKIAPDQSATTIDSSYTSAVSSITVTDPAGNIYIVGYAGSPNLKKYNQAGTLLWSITLGDPITDLTLDSDGNVYVVRMTSSVGTAYIKKYNSSGTLLGTVTPIYIYKIRAGSNGKLYALYGFSSSKVKCYIPDWATNTLGDTVWAGSIADTPADAKFQMDGNENSYIGYSSFTNNTYKVDNNGIASGFISGGSSYAYGGIYCTPNYLYASIYSQGFLEYRKYNYSGTLIETVSFSVISTAYSHYICVDKSGCVYITYRAGATLYLVKAPPSSNIPIFTIVLGDTNGATSHVKFDVTPGHYSSFPGSW